MESEKSRVEDDFLNESRSKISENSAQEEPNEETALHSFEIDQTKKLSRVSTILGCERTRKLLETSLSIKPDQALLNKVKICGAQE
ncbi:MAG: hypothetical protein MHPSP_001761 [Paramarteilia canceri]